MPLKIAAKVDAQDRDYWEAVVEPSSQAIRKSNSSVKSTDLKGGFPRQRRNTAVPDRLAGTFRPRHDRSNGLRHPVLAFRYGSAPEVIEDGVSGILVDTLEEAVKRLGRTLELDRQKVRESFDRRFTAERMTRDYLEIYQNLPGAHKHATSAHSEERKRVGLEAA